MTPTAEHKTESSGESFLSKILGNGPRESTDSSEDAMRLHEKHESDSDSDFFAWNLELSQQNKCFDMQFIKQFHGHKKQSHRV